MHAANGHAANGHHLRVPMHVAATSFIGHAMVNGHSSGSSAALSGAAAPNGAVPAAASAAAFANSAVPVSAAHMVKLAGKLYAAGHA